MSLIFIVLNIQIIISEYQNITIKMYEGLNQSIINENYTKFIQEIYINDELQTNIISTYNLSEEYNTIKLIFNSTLIDCSNMFKNCFNIYEIDFKDFNTSEIEFMYGLFYNCNSLKSIDLSDFYIPKVKAMANLFYNCSSLISLDLSSFDTSKVTRMNHMFFNCKSLNISCILVIEENLILDKFIDVNEEHP